MGDFMAGNFNETRGSGKVQVFDASMIEDAAEQERLNRTLRRPGERSVWWPWLAAAGMIAALLFAGLIGYLVHSWLS